MSNGLIMKYFVLSPLSNDSEHRAASQSAILAYARDIRTTNPALAKELRDWVASLPQ